MRGLRTPALAGVLLLVPLALVLAVSPSPDPAAESGAYASGAAADDTVVISYNPNSRRITVSKDPVTIRAGEAIAWSAGSGVEAWAVDIPSSKAPFGQGVRDRGIRGRKGGPPGTARARADAPSGTYKYTVAIYDGQDVRILDPDIVIN